MQIKAFFDQDTCTISYIIIDNITKNCAIIDSVLNYNLFAGKISTTSADALIAFVRQNNLLVEWILETHIHADHLTASSYLQKNLLQKSLPKIAIGEGIFAVLQHWLKVFNIESEELADGKQFNHIFRDNEIFKIGNLEAKFIATEGHTPACGSYLIKDCVFVGDLMFMPNLGTGRTDFPAGDAALQFDSIKKIFSLPLTTKVFTGHDYPKEGQNPVWESTVFDQKEHNILAKINNKQQYIEARKARDKTLAVPKLLYPAIQINLRAGKMPNSENNGLIYIKTPLDTVR